MSTQFADALKRLLKGAGMSGNKLADKIEVDPASVSRWRSGDGVPKPENISRLADVFGVERAWLFSLAYPSEEPRSASLDPRLSAFLSQIEAGWLAMDDESVRDVAERGARAMFHVEDVRRKHVTDEPGKFDRHNGEGVQTKILKRRPYERQSVALQKIQFGFKPFL